MIFEVVEFAPFLVVQNQSFPLVYLTICTLRSDLPRKELYRRNKSTVIRTNSDWPGRAGVPRPPCEVKLTQVH
jgi:hypothetical protein